MKVSFELSPRDIQFFRERLKEVRSSGRARDESAVTRGAVALIEQALESEPPDFIVERIHTLAKLVGMLADREWRLVGADRARILDALAYFVDPEDLIHDQIPGIGFLDDAIMVELVAGELRHEIAAYDDFCEFRKSRPENADAERLEKRRLALQARMRRRRRRDRETKRPRGASRSRMRLW